ncbi:hypothetical protein G9A89_007725 [Geosiphon pyriformis]|nr:hypothetical protein G9A89_007725 [Geosiphon pyriformis]
MRIAFEHQVTGLNHNHISVESVFNFYINKKIAYLLGTPVNTESAKETFYSKLIQNTSLLANHNFTSIITEINKKIEHHIQQRYPITYASKDKEKLQTPAGIHIKHDINIQMIFIPKQTKENRSTRTIQNLITTASTGLWNHYLQENSEIETLNIQALQNQKPEVINQHLPPVIVIDQPPQQQQMTYAPIAKLNKFTGKENDAQVWLNNIEKAITANGWNDTRAMQPTLSLQLNKEKWKQLPHIWDASIEICDKSKQLMLNISQYYKFSINSSVACAVASCNMYDTITHARDFESAKLEANHVHAVNLVMNGSSELDSKLKQFSDLINQKLKGYLADNHIIYQPPQQCNNSGNANYFQNHHGSQRCASVTTVKPRLLVPNSELLPKSKSNYLSTNDTVPNLSTTSISNSSLSNTYNLSTTAISNLLAAASSNLLTPTTNSNTTTKLASKWNSKAEDDTTKLVISDGIRQTNKQNLVSGISGTGAIQNPNFQNYLSLLVIPEDATTNNSKSNQPQTTLTNNILPAMVTENESLTAIFPFKLEETINSPLFSGTALKEKLITAMYTDAKVDDHSIKLILDSRSAGSIITRQFIDQLADGATKTPIGEINNFPIEVNGIIVPIKVLVMEATQYQALIRNNWLSKINAKLNWNMQELQLSQNGQHTRVPATCDHFKPSNVMSAPLVNFEKEKEKSTWEAYQILWANINHNELLPILTWDDNDNKKKQREESIWKTTIDAWNNDRKEKEKEEDLSEETNKATEKLTSGWKREYSCEPIKEPPYIPLKCQDCKKKLFSMEAWITSETTNHVLFVANNYSMKECGMTFLVKKKHATLCASTQFSLATGFDKWQMPKSKKPCPLNTQLCDHYLIPYDFQYCDDCDLTYNPPPCIIYTIPEEEKPINNCVLESESSSNSDSNSDNDNNENNSSSSIQNGYDNDSNSDSNSNSNYEQYIALPNLTKKQELKWFSDNDEGIMPERVHDTNARFDLRYLRKDAIKLELHLCTCIDLKIELEIPATTMVQLASRSSLAKKGINIREEIINAGYVENIIAMLQNDSEKAYVIEPNKRITQAIFLPLVKIT